VSTHPFDYRGQHLHCEGVAIEALAAAHGTPLYVYSRGSIEAAYRAYAAALAGVRHAICYSVKANSSLGILGVLAGLGAGADIVSGGELVRWQRAGGDARKVVFSGVGKTRGEIEAALAAQIRAFNVESAEELALIDEVATAHGVRAPVALRVNPDVDPQTHPYISTGLAKNKFGVPAAEARAQLLAASERRGLEVVGVDCHIGSQLTKTEPFADAIARLCELILALHADGLRLRSLDLGGGLGIDYGADGVAPPPSHGEYGRAVLAALAPLAALDLEIIVEPGRSIVGPAGALITRVVGRKHNGERHFTIVDAAMNDLMRPALYGAHHPMQPVRRDAAAPTQITDVVGPICETGDFFARERALPALAAGDLLSIGAAGAYGMAMASNYNTRPRAAEVLVEGDRVTVIRDRETVDDLLRGERLA
jgi:diaminopimelate decarboxylase